MLTFPLRASRFHRPNTAQWPVPLRDTQAPAPEHSLQVVKQQGPSEVEGPKCEPSQFWSFLFCHPPPIGLLKEHVVQVCWVLQLLLQNGLYGNLEKSLFCVSTISFLGVVVSQDGLSMEPLRTKVVRS
ncbi:mucin-5AC-like [Tachysurus ichikawai]